jgi:hypothetical protein
MKRALFVVAAVLLASATVLAADAKQKAKFQGVVVDPMDLRQPVPDPQAGLTEKYDGKLVRFTGSLQKWGQDSKSYWYELRTELPKPSGVGKANKDAKNKNAKDVVVVRLYLETKDKGVAAPKAGLPLTVEGTGEITTDGSLNIRKGHVVDIGALPGS